MYVLYPRIDMVLPNGDVWETWRLDWTDRDGAWAYQLFDDMHVALAFMVEIALRRRRENISLNSEEAPR